MNQEHELILRMADARSAGRDEWMSRSRLAVWFQLMRVGSLAISGIAVFVGGAAALFSGHWSPLILLALAGAIAIQIGTNLTNVSFNWKAVAARGSRPADPQGSSAPVQLGLVEPEEVRRVAYFAFGVAILIGVLLVWSVGWPILLFGIPGIAVGYFYSAPPIRLAYLGLGVAAVFLSIGAMVVGSYYTVALTISPTAIVAALPIGLLAAGIMHTNDLRDHDGDVRHGKRTLSTLLGGTAPPRLLLALVAGAYLSIPAGIAAALLPWPTLIVILTLPLAVRQIRLVFRERDPKRLNEAWFMGVKLMTAFGVLFVAGLLVGVWLR